MVFGQKALVKPQVAQAQNMTRRASASIGIVAQHSKYKDLYGEKNLSFL